MAGLKGQLDGLDYPKSVPSAMHNVAGMVKSATKMKGQHDKGMKDLSNRMPGVSHPKVGMKGQNS